ncbi:zinc metalloprotease HtpX [Leuconostoc carnosum]|uniref:Protease HtpX homolog n=2 Tax=Leuconostoc carnosum TaxID=1252 RepID=K0DAQ1_LEUCJ|nr:MULTISPECIES: zinc metalloprotease HtpX [Leuconostoc]AFT81925.1 heat shock protein HtpX [Leuconostoc carnosum JB16]KAA8325474.1 zinc metalloprotease HtpX [Leuconostoc carnosum]KAA8328503.1 zinc metalloprotease HtpX [Leuconostoc carnosum]KAA8359696.1 zinc metalloprotease HtpX [Leuconostoc carnosum]KAA8365271.1 zinc metalloprotease HtpX [Leuconostoc carnosum]
MLYEQIQSNKRRTIVLLVGFFILVAIVGAAVGYLLLGSLELGIIAAIVIGVIYTLIMISNSTSVVMAMNHGTEIKNADEEPELWHTVEDMSMVAQVPMPRVFIIQDDSPNAFATGNSPKNSAVAATTGLLKIMNRHELEGVIGHEISHIRNYDIRISTIALALTAAISLLVNLGSNWWFWGSGTNRRDNRESGSNGAQIFLLIFSIIIMVLAPLVATVVQLAISRNREYLADAGSVELTRNPEELISALSKLGSAKPMENVDPSSASLYISNPLKQKKHLFDTHPPIEERIARLQKM